MIRLLWKCVHLVLRLGVLGIGCYFFHGMLRRPLGRYLIAADPLEKADDLVLLAGRASRAVIVITPKRQSGRAKHLCSEALAPAIVCRSHPASDDPFDPTHWWSDWQQVGDVASEYAALAVDLGRTWWQRFRSPAAVPPAVTIR